MTLTETAERLRALQGEHCYVHSPDERITDDHVAENQEFLRLRLDRHGIDLDEALEVAAQSARFARRMIAEAASTRGVMQIDEIAEMVGDAFIAGLLVGLEVEE